MPKGVRNPPPPTDPIERAIAREQREINKLESAIERLVAPYRKEREKLDAKLQERRALVTALTRGKAAAR